MTAEVLYLAALRQEMWAEHQWEDLWCRTYAVGVYAAIPESHRAWLRSVNPWFCG
jgi:hypothetical protein